MRIGIFILYVRDLAATTAFYTQTVGLNIVSELTDDHFIALTDGGQTLLGLEDARNLPADRILQPGSVELGFEVQDIVTTHRAWEAAGVALLSAIEPMPGGRSFLACDPDGYVLSVYSLDHRG